MNTNKQTSENNTTNIWYWLKNVIAKPRKRLGGHAICPYLQKYMDRIKIVESATPCTVADNFAIFHRQFGLEAVIVHGFNWDFDRTHLEVDRINRKHKKNNIECLAMCPDSEDAPLNINYNYKEPLIILQKRSTLLEARKQLSKMTDYYTYYNG